MKGAFSNAKDGAGPILARSHGIVTRIWGDTASIVSMQTEKLGPRDVLQFSQDHKKRPRSRDFPWPPHARPCVGSRLFLKLSRARESLKGVAEMQILIQVKCGERPEILHFCKPLADVDVLG